MSSDSASPRGDAGKPTSPSAPPTALDTARHHAKIILARARSGDAEAIARLRPLLPRLADRSDENVASSIKLADVQHALARQQGVANWAALKQQLEALDPLAQQVERFLTAIRDDKTPRAEALLAAHPQMSGMNIFAAAAACDAKSVERMLANDAHAAHAEHRPERGTPLVYACQSRMFSASPERARASARIVTMLLDAGASANTLLTLPHDQNTKLPVLYFACVANNVPVVAALLERGADPNDGESLYHAAELDHRECLALLLEHGADVSSRHPMWDNTPLFFCAGFHSYSPGVASADAGMRWLLAHGADPNVASYVKARTDGSAPDAETPLHRIASFGRSAAMAAELVGHGAVVDAPRGDGKTAYALALRAGNRPVADYLVSAGADARAATAADRLLGACLAADETGARDVIAAHPGVITALGDEEKQMLGTAIGEGNEPAVRLMLALGWSVTEELRGGGTPLHWAAWQGRTSIARDLIGRGASPNVRDSRFGSSPLGWAGHGSVNARPGHDDDYIATAGALIDAGAQHDAAHNRWRESAESLASAAVGAYIRQRFAARKTE